MKIILALTAAISLFISPNSTSADDWKALTRRLMEQVIASDFSKSVEPARQALDAAMAQYGPKHPNTARALNNLGWVYLQLDQYDKAEPCLARSVKVWQSVVEPEYSEYALAMDNLARCYKSRGQFVKMVVLDRRVLTALKLARGEPYPDLGSVPHTTLDTQSLGEMEAEPFNAMVREALQRTDDTRYEVGLDLCDLAYSYMKDYQYEYAEQLFSMSLEILEKKLGPDDARLAKTIIGLGASRAHYGDIAGAEYFYVRALNILEHAPQRDNDQIVQMHWRIRDLFFLIGQPDWGRELDKRLEAIAVNAIDQQREVGLTPVETRMDHQHAGALLEDPAVQAKLADRYLDQAVRAEIYDANYAFAESLYQTVLRLRVQALGPDHPQVAETHRRIADLYKAEGLFSLAEDHYKNALAVREAVMAPDDPNILLLRKNLAELSQAYPQAEKEIQTEQTGWGLKATEIDHETGKDAPVKAGKRLAGWDSETEAEWHRLNAEYEKSSMAQDYISALVIAGRASWWASHHVGPRHPDTAASYDRLVQLMTAKGKTDEAELYAQIAEKIRRRARQTP